jgi:hypothetical protein
MIRATEPTFNAPAASTRIILGLDIWGSDEIYFWENIKNAFKMRFSKAKGIWVILLFLSFQTGAV